jgi:hypothetical protein
MSSDYGVVLTLRGVEGRFGGSSRTDAKWAALAAILADPRLTSVTYVDVRAPGRPAVGGAGTSSDPLPATNTAPPVTPEPVVPPSGG